MLMNCEYGTILSVKENDFWYLSCTKCHKKINPTTSKCQYCKNNQSEMGYKLILEVHGNHGLLFINLFGNQVANFFGKTATFFNNEIRTSANRQLSRQMLCDAVGKCFVGHTVTFKIKCKNDTKGWGNSFVVEDLVKCNKNSFTVWELYSLPKLKVIKTENSNLVDHSLSTLMPQELHNNKCSASEDKNIRSNLNNSFQGDSNSPHNCTFCHGVKPSLKRSQSDSFTFLQDSFVKDLFKQHRSLFKHAKKNKSEENIFEVSEYLNVMSSNASDTSCEILDEITLPVITQLCEKWAKQQKKIEFFEPNSIALYSNSLCPSISDTLQKLNNKTSALPSKCEHSFFNASLHSCENIELSNSQPLATIPKYASTPLKTNKKRRASFIRNLHYCESPDLFSTPFDVTKNQNDNHIDTSCDLFL